MALIDAKQNFTLPTIANSTAAAISPNVFDAGSAVKFFGGPNPPKVTGVTGALTADAAATIRIDVVGADDAALTTNPVVLGSTGTLTKRDDGVTDIGTGGAAVKLPFTIAPVNQRVAKRFYGLVAQMGGTNPDMAAGGTAQVVGEAQSNHLFV